MKVRWAVLCSDRIIDQETNNLSIINIIEEMRIGAIPGKMGAESGGQLVSPILLVSVWERTQDSTPEKADVRMVVKKPGTTDHTEGRPFELELAKHRRLRHTLGIPIIPITNEGTYYFELQLRGGDDEWVVEYSIPLEIHISDPESPEV